MTTSSVIDDQAALTGPADTWQERLLEIARGLRTALLGHRDGAKVRSGSRLTGTDHAREMEEHLRVLTAAGPGLVQAVGAARTVTAYTIGFVTEEQGVKPLPGERREGYGIEERARRLAGHPLAAEAGRVLFDGYDEQFEEGPALVIAGIEARRTG
ncbi:TetR/AcrR family transcriptional regulator C-terminal domain-containing protein [Streptomyces sp. NPDC048045]|uniref:TetR/AcrR family transcriptional regulator C-terminal domain-containing protein n=1 Tax=Streptomyces sp. NPDC048045 TaxID=3154710 RepID=UPI003425FC39